MSLICECRHCNQDSEVDELVDNCPVCDSDEISLVGDAASEEDLDDMDDDEFSFN